MRPVRLARPVRLLSLRLAGRRGRRAAGRSRQGEAAGVKPGLDGWVGAAGRRVATAEGS